MSHKRQFQTAVQRRTFFDRKVVKFGYSRAISLGKIIPKDWLYVRITPIEKSDKEVLLKIEKLLGDETLAPSQKTNKGRGQDT